MEEVIEAEEPAVDDQEPVAENQAPDNSPLVAIDIQDCLIATNKLSDNSLYLLKICHSETHSGTLRRPLIEIATESKEESLAWKLAIEDVKTKAKSQEEQILRLQSSERTAREMSDMVIYCCPVPLSSEGELHTHSHTITHKYRCTHTCTHTNIHVRMYACPHTLLYACMNAHSHNFHIHVHITFSKIVLSFLGTCSYLFRY